MQPVRVGADDLAAERSFPLEAAETDVLLARLEQGLRDLHRLEREGVALLRGIAGA